MPLIFVTVALFGMYTASSMPAIDALFADSVETGRRSFVFTLKHTVRVGSSAIGPVTAIVLFATMGDRWTPSILIMVLCVGLALCIPPVLIQMCCFRESRGLGAASEALVDHDIDTPSETLINEGNLADIETNHASDTDNDVEPSLPQVQDVPDVYKVWTLLQT